MTKNNDWWNNLKDKCKKCGKKFVNGNKMCFCSDK